MKKVKIAILNICGLDAIPEPDRFIGCDGRVLSDELLEIQLDMAVEREDYEDAALIRDELKRRNKELTNDQIHTK